MCLTSVSIRVKEWQASSLRSYDGQGLPNLHSCDIPAFLTSNSAILSSSKHLTTRRVDVNPQKATTRTTTRAYRRRSAASCDLSDGRSGKYEFIGLGFSSHKWYLPQTWNCVGGIGDRKLRVLPLLSIFISINALSTPLTPA